jgi:hypothetical protein
MAKMHEAEIQNKQRERLTEMGNAFDFPARCGN